MSSVVVEDIGFSEAELRELYERHDGVICQVAEDIGQTEDVARHRLIKHGIHEAEPYLTHDLGKLLPQDIGLSHLRCGNCRDKITEHPCSQCGWSPDDPQCTLERFSGGDD